MPSQSGAKTRKHKTRNHSNLRPKHKHSKDYLKVYYPYLPLVVITILILSILQPWQSLFSKGQDVLPYATQMSIQGLVEETNERRSASNQSTLQLNEQLNKAAQAKAKDMVNRDYWSHNTPDGNAPWEFVNNAGYSYKKAGENLAYGFKDEDEVIAGWMNSPSHRANMLDANYQEVGFGFAESQDFVKSGPTTIVVAMYGQPSGAPTFTDTSGPTDSKGYNTLAAQGEPTDTGVSRFQTFFTAPTWISYLVAGVTGALIAYLLVKHGRRIKRTLVHGEQFVIHHPLLDATIISIIVLSVVISQQVGIIR